jgi:hypothetical protein
VPSTTTLPPTTTTTAVTTTSTTTTTVPTTTTTTLPDDDSDDHGPRRFKAKLQGFNEVPAVSTTGHGTFKARIDRRQDSIAFTLIYEGLEGLSTAAHIHFGQEKANGGIAAFLCGGGGRPACPSFGGIVEGVITRDDVIGPAGQGIAATEFRELFEAMREGKTYVNVHSDKHPSGEIRGRVSHR